MGQHLSLCFSQPCLTVLKSTSQAFCQMSLSLSYSDVCWWLDWDCIFWRKEYHKVPFLLHNIREDAWYHHDFFLIMLSLISWLKYHMPGFSTKLLWFFSLCIFYTLVMSQWLLRTPKGVLGNEATAPEVRIIYIYCLEFFSNE